MFNLFSHCWKGKFAQGKIIRISEIVLAVVIMGNIGEQSLTDAIHILIRLHWPVSWSVRLEPQGPGYTITQASSTSFSHQ